MDNNTQNYKTAEELLVKADKWLFPNAWNALFKSAEERADKAFECYEEASHLYLIDKYYSKAGDCLVKCAKIKEELKESFIYYIEEAKNCYIKDNNAPKVTEVMGLLISGCVSKGKFKEAAKYQVDNAVVLESTSQYKEAINAYEKAIDYYMMDKESSIRDINTARINQADLMCINDDILAKEKAKRIYEAAGDDYLTERFNKDYAKDLYSKCVLCYLLYDDYLSARAFLHRFYEKDISLKGDSIAEFLEQLIGIMADENYMEFYKVVENYKKSKMKWDKWMNVMIGKLENKIKETIKNEPNFAEEDEDWK